MAFLMNTPWNFLLTLQFPLFIASAVNVGLAVVVYFALRNVEIDLD